MKVEVPIVNAFVDESVGGNPAGVVLDAQQYSRDQMQRIAAGVGLSERKVNQAQLIFNGNSPTPASLAERLGMFRNEPLESHPVTPFCNQPNVDEIFEGTNYGTRRFFNKPSCQEH